MIFFQHDANAVNCDSELSLQLQSAALTAFRKMAGNVDVDVPKLMSGAGHDAMAMAHLTKVSFFAPFPLRCVSEKYYRPVKMAVDGPVRLRA